MSSELSSFLNQNTSQDVPINIGNSNLAAVSEYYRQEHMLENRKNSKRIPKKGQQTVSQMINVEMTITIVSRSEFLLFGGIRVVLDDDVCLFSQLQAMTIGNRNNQPITLQIQNKEKRVDCQMQKMKVSLTDFDFLAEFCKRKQQVNYLQLASLIEKYQNYTRRLQSFKQKYLNLTKAELIYSDRAYGMFIEHVKQIIQNKDPNGMYRYAIGKMNYLLGDQEMQFVGMSTGFLNMIGLSPELFRQLFLRKKMINLRPFRVKDSFDFSVEALEQRLNPDYCAREIKGVIQTIDGFPLQILEKVTKIKSPFEPFPQSSPSHLAFIIDFEIEQNSYLSLMEYRKSLVLEKQFMNYEEFMNKKLNNDFEDIEYSVKSEKFINKYYPEK